MADIAAQFGLSELALLATALFAGYMLFPVSSFAFGRIKNVWAGMFIWVVFVFIVFAPSILISAFAQCNFREYVALFGIFVGSVSYKLWSAYRFRSNHAH